MTVVLQPQHPVGLTIPPYTDHAISVSLPTWLDNVGYEEGDPRVLNTMQTGYPRFFVHKSIEKVCSYFVTASNTWSRLLTAFIARGDLHAEVRQAQREEHAFCYSKDR